MENNQLALLSFLKDILSGIKALKEDVSRLEERLDCEARKAFSSEWIYGEDVPAIMHISPRTWERWKAKRVIPFSQHERKIYVNRKDLDAFMKAHRIEACAQAMQEHEFYSKEDLIFNDHGEPMENN